MAGTPVRRPAKTKAAGFAWWDDLPHAFSHPAQHLRDALTRLNADPRNEPALAVARDYAREMLIPVARALGISDNDPLLVENVAFRLAADRRLWSDAAPPAGRPAGDKAERAKKATEVAEFVDQMKGRNTSLTDTDCLSNFTFKTRFQIGETAGRKLLAEGRAQQQRT